MLGEIVESLKQLGVADNTLLIVTGDNGAEHRVYAPLRESNAVSTRGGIACRLSPGGPMP